MDHMKYLNDTGVEHLLHGEWENMIDFIESAFCLLYTSPSPRDRTRSRMPSSA